MKPLNIQQGLIDMVADFIGFASYLQYSFACLVELVS